MERDRGESGCDEHSQQEPPKATDEGHDNDQDRAADPFGNDRQRSLGVVIKGVNTTTEGSAHSGEMQKHPNHHHGRRHQSQICAISDASAETSEKILRVRIAGAIRTANGESGTIAHPEQGQRKQYERTAGGDDPEAITKDR